MKVELQFPQKPENIRNILQFSLITDNKRHKLSNLGPHQSKRSIQNFSMFTQSILCLSFQAIWIGLNLNPYSKTQIINQK